MRKFLMAVLAVIVAAIVGLKLWMCPSEPPLRLDACEPARGVTQGAGSGPTRELHPVDGEGGFRFLKARADQSDTSSIA